LVFGTVKNHIHDIGRDIVGMLEVNGFQVCDLGTGQPEEAFAKVVGGGRMDDRVCKYMRADAHGGDAAAAMAFAKQAVGVA
jgi:methanogenic corrinoid protein MtbC1